MVNRQANINKARALQVNNKLSQNLIGKQIQPFSTITPFTTPLYEPVRSIYDEIDLPVHNKNTYIPRSIYSKNPLAYVSPDYWTQKTINNNNNNNNNTTTSCPFYYVNGKVALGKTIPESTLDICGDVKINGQLYLNGRAYSSMGDFAQDQIIYGNKTFLGNVTMKRLSVMRIHVNDENNNTIYGNGVLDTNIGSYNTGIGYQTLRDNETGCNNTAVGFGALLNNTIGLSNNAFGSNCLQQNTTGVNNCGFGFFALINNTTGVYNCALGAYTLVNNITGNRNIGIGNNAGLNNTSGSSNIYIGDSADTEDGTVNNSIAIGSKVNLTKSNQIILGSKTHSVYIPGQVYLEKPVVYLDGTSSSSSSSEFVVPTEDKIGYTINADLEPVLITLDGKIHTVGSISINVGVWIITYGVNFTNGSGDINGANISRIQYGLSENTETISLTSSMNDSSELTVVNYNKPFYNNGLVKVVTNTEPNKIYYLLGSILATGEGLVFGGNISATRIA
jgi:hypothetical protein